MEDRLAWRNDSLPGIRFYARWAPLLFAGVGAVVFTAGAGLVGLVFFALPLLAIAAYGIWTVMTRRPVDELELHPATGSITLRHRGVATDLPLTSISKVWVFRRCLFSIVSPSTSGSPLGLRVYVIGLMDVPAASFAAAMFDIGVPVREEWDTAVVSDGRRFMD